jgi:hypothetical protein
MSITAFDGPIVGGIPGAPIAGMPSDTNPEAAPSVFSHGVALLDVRGPYTYIPGQNFGKAVCGWLNSGWCTLDQAISTVTANNIVTTATPVSGTALTLVTTASSTSGITVGVTIVSAATGQNVTGLLALDGPMTTQKYGPAGTIQMWAPTAASARNIRIIDSGDDSAGTFTVSGYDIYNFPMNEAIRGVASATAVGKKAFKYIKSITPSGVFNSIALTVGNGTAIGLPLRADTFPQMFGVYGNSTIITSAGFTAADTTSPATLITGDVRGTYVPQTTPTGLLKLTVYQAITPANVGTATGIVGITQA